MMIVGRSWLECTYFCLEEACGLLTKNKGWPRGALDTNNSTNRSHNCTISSTNTFNVGGFNSNPVIRVPLHQAK